MVREQTFTWRGQRICFSLAWAKKICLCLMRRQGINLPLVCKQRINLLFGLLSGIANTFPSRINLPLHGMERWEWPWSVVSRQNSLPHLLWLLQALTTSWTIQTVSWRRLRLIVCIIGGRKNACKSAQPAFAAKYQIVIVCVCGKVCGLAL